MTSGCGMEFLKNAAKEATADAKDMLQDGFSGLERLKRNLQSAAALCQPAGASAAIYETEGGAGANSFDSADLDEEDPDEGGECECTRAACAARPDRARAAVGVDERAALLQPEDFFLDDEEWYASAQWVMERPQTEEFIAAALVAHMAPLYVPYADIRARTAKDVVPADVRREMRSFAADFVAETNLRALSVKDVKDGIAEGLGDVGAAFLPQDVAPYDLARADELLDERGAPLGPFADTFDDLPEAWASWHCLLAGLDDDEEEEEEEDEEESDGAGEGDAQAFAREHRVLEEGMAPTANRGAGGLQADLDSDKSEEDQSGDEPQAVSTRDVGVGVESDWLPAAATLARGVSREDVQGEKGEQALRELVLSIIRKASPQVYTGRQVTLGALAEGALGNFIQRLQHGRNARNALMLLRRIACHPLPLPPRPKPLAVGVIWQAFLKILAAGPLRSVRLETEDFPPAAVQLAYDCAVQTAHKSQHWPPTQDGGEEALLLDALRADSEAIGGSAGWCLKFLFEGHDSLHDAPRRRASFLQFACEAKYGPLAGVVVAGDNEWAWDTGLIPADDALKSFAETYGDAFTLAHGDTLASILDDFVAALRVAGFADLASDAWHPVPPAAVEGQRGKGPHTLSPVKMTQGGGVNSVTELQEPPAPPVADDFKVPAFGALPSPAMAAAKERSPVTEATSSPLSVEPPVKCPGVSKHDEMEPGAEEPGVVSERRGGGLL